MKEPQDYEVILRGTIRKTYIVTARTPEEAEDLALDEMAQDFDHLEDSTVEDVFPVEALSSDEIFRL